MQAQQIPEPTGGTGYLIVRVATAGGAIPIEGAAVKIWESGYGGVRHHLRSDRDGNTPRIALPTPPRSLSYTPGEKPYALYNADVSAVGFYPMHFVDIPFYDGITSIQNADLIPLPEGTLYDANSPLGDVVEGVNPQL